MWRFASDTRDRDLWARGSGRGKELDREEGPSEVETETGMADAGGEGVGAVRRRVEMGVGGSTG